MSYSQLEREEASRQFHVFLHKNPLLRQDIDPDKDNRYQVNIIYTLYGRVARVWCNAPRIDFVTILDFAFPYGTKGKFRLIRRSIQEKPTVHVAPATTFPPRHPVDVVAIPCYCALITPEEMQKLTRNQVYNAIDFFFQLLFFSVCLFLTVCMYAFARFATPI